MVEKQLLQLLGVLTELPLAKEITLPKVKKVKPLPGVGPCPVSSGWAGGRGIFKDPAPCLDD